MSTNAEPLLRRHRINVDEYHRMAEVGLLAPDARVELIQGEVIDMAPIGTRHGAVVDALARLLIRAVNDHAIVRVQGSIRLDRHSEPQPDLSILKPRKDFYRDVHPTATDVLLIIEVSDTTLRYDRNIKAPLYASHGVPEVWLIDVNSKVLQRMQHPAGNAYATTSTFDGDSADSNIALAMLPGVSIDVAAILNL